MEEFRESEIFGNLPMVDDDNESQQTEEHRSTGVRHTRITDRPEIP